MENIILPKNFDYPLINTGAHARCIKYNPNIILKIWHSTPTINSENLKDFFKLDDSDFKFPRSTVYNDEIKYIGYSMEYIDGIILQNISDSTPLCDILKAYAKALKAIKNISESGILTYDISESNIIYKNAHFYFVDTDPYTLTSKNTSINNRINAYEFVKTLFLFFISQENRIMNIINSDFSLNDMYINYNLGYPFDFERFIEIFTNHLVKYTNLQINTCGDLKKSQYVYTKN